METKKFQYFYLQQDSGNLLKIQCLFEDFDKEILEEARGVFEVILIGTKLNVGIFLDKLKRIPSEFLFMLLNFAKDLKEENRNLAAFYPNIIFEHYIEHFHLENLIQIHE